jgi:type II secretory pathway pseudopilin PulG
MVRELHAGPAMWPPVRAGDNRGCSLIETLISAALLAVLSAGVAPLVAIAVQANRDARGQTSASLLAVQKMEQLRSLTWRIDAATGLTITDLTTDISVDPPTQGGPGLSASPPQALAENVPGYCDFVDQHGAWVGNGALPPAGAVYVRRWSISPLPSEPDRTLVVQVVVVPLADSRRQAGPTGARRGRSKGDAWLVSVRTRQAD